MVSVLIWRIFLSCSPAVYMIDQTNKRRLSRRHEDYHVIIVMCVCVSNTDCLCSIWTKLNLFWRKKSEVKFGILPSFSWAVSNVIRTDGMIKDKECPIDAVEHTPCACNKEETVRMKNASLKLDAYVVGQASGEWMVKYVFCCRFTG